MKLVQVQGPALCRAHRGVIVNECEFLSLGVPVSFNPRAVC